MSNALGKVAHSVAVLSTFSTCRPTCACNLFFYTGLFEVIFAQIYQPG
jgi:hypothetical protein